MNYRNNIAAFLVGLVLLVSASCVAQAATYYVATTGNDSNPGTEVAPWRTLQKAFNAVGGGDTVLFKAGTYAQGRARNLHPPAGQWITFKPYQNDRVIIDSGTGEGGIRISGASYLIIEGFEITNTGYNHSLPNSCDLVTSEACRSLARSMRYASGGIMIDSTVYRNATTDTHHLIIRNNHIHHNKGGGIAGGEGPSAGIAGSHDWEISNNHIHHNGYAGLSPGYGTYIEGSRFWVHNNVLHDNSGNNMRIGNIVDRHMAVDWIIENNLSYNARGPFWHFSSGRVFPENWGFVLYGIKGSVFRNNISYGNWGEGLWVVNIDPAKPTLVYNNTFYGNGGAGMRLSGKVIARNNISWGNATRVSAYQMNLTSSHTGVAENNLVGGGSLLINNGGSGTESNNIRNADPLFENAGGGDFHLKAGSAAIDKGLALAEVVEDFDRGARPAGAVHDIGAFESGALPRICSVPGTAVAVPTNVIDPATGNPPTRPGYVLVGAVPAGFTLSAGAVERSVPEGTIYRLNLAQLAGLTLTPPADFKGTVKIEAFFVPQ